MFAAAAMMAAQPAAMPHHDAVEHRGVAYQVAYVPQVRVRMKTVGMSAGTRMSTERCRWTAEVQVERTIRRHDAAAGHGRLLPSTWTSHGSRPGSCAQAGDALGSEQVARLDAVRRHVADVAARDRTALLADIDAAHTLVAAN